MALATVSSLAVRFFQGRMCSSHRGGVHTVDRSHLWSLIEQEARLLGMTKEEAVERVQRGDVGEGYLWSDLASLVAMLLG